MSTPLARLAWRGAHPGLGLERVIYMRVANAGPAPPLSPARSAGSPLPPPHASLRERSCLADPFPSPPSQAIHSYRLADPTSGSGSPEATSAVGCSEPRFERAFPETTPLLSLSLCRHDGTLTPQFACQVMLAVRTVRHGRNVPGCNIHPQRLSRSAPNNHGAPPLPSLAALASEPPHAFATVRPRSDSPQKRGWKRKQTGSQWGEGASAAREISVNSVRAGERTFLNGQRKA